MYTFRIGQKVRVTKIEEEHNRHLLGKEGIVLEIIRTPFSPDKGGYGLDIAPILFAEDEDGLYRELFHSDQLKAAVQ